MSPTKKLSRIGKSQGIIILQPVLDQLNWNDDTEIELKVNGTELVVTEHKYIDETEFKRAAKKVFHERKRLMQRLAR